jgi:hypothetical protein
MGIRLRLKVMKLRFGWALGKRKINQNMGFNEHGVLGHTGGKRSIMDTMADWSRDD